MTDDKSSMSTTERQRAFRKRLRDMGYKQTTVWIHAETEEEGRQAARDGKPLQPMLSRHPLSWAMGWVKEMEKQ